MGISEFQVVAMSLLIGLLMQATKEINRKNEVHDTNVAPDNHNERWTVKWLKRGTVVGIWLGLGNVTGRNICKF